MGRNNFYKLVNCINDQVVYTDDAGCPECAGVVGNLVATNFGCRYILTYDSIPSIITPININLEIICPTCLPKCYTITGTGNVSYITIYDGYVVETATAPVKICSYSYPTVSGLDNEIFIGEGCNLISRCPTSCYELTNCDIKSRTWREKCSDFLG